MWIWGDRSSTSDLSLSPSSIPTPFPNTRRTPVPHLLFCHSLRHFVYSLTMDVDLSPLLCLVLYRELATASLDPCPSTLAYSSYFSIHSIRISFPSPPSLSQCRTTTRLRYQRIRSSGNSRLRYFTLPRPYFICQYHKYPTSSTLFFPRPAPPDQFSVDRLRLSLVVIFGTCKVRGMIGF